MNKESLLKILLLVWAAFSPALLSAQELQITDARRTIEPMTVPLQRLDYNNQICALVKVVLPLADVKFEGNVVGEPVLKTSEYMVYLTPGTKMLKILAPGYYPVMADFTELGVGPLESKTIYYITVKAIGTGLAQQVTIAEGTPASISDSLQKQTTAALAETTSSVSSGQYSTAPINLALCAELNGQIVYITQAQWEKMSATEQAACKNKWLCVIGDYEGKTYRFLLALNDSGEKYMTWDEAMSRYGNSLPTKKQGEVMAKNYEAIEAAIIAFGGDSKGVMYWTGTEYNSSKAWGFNMTLGRVGHYYKDFPLHVRAVAQVPFSAM